MKRAAATDHGRVATLGAGAERTSSQPGAELDSAKAPGGAVRSDTGRLLRLLAVVVVVAILGLARELLIPVALAVLLAFVLTPAVVAMQRIGLPRLVAVAVAMSTAVAVALLVIGVVTVQSIAFVGDLPSYRGTIREKLQHLEPDPDGWFSRAQRGLLTLEKEVRDATTAGGPDSAEGIIAPELAKPEFATPELVPAAPNAIERPDALAVPASDEASPLAGALHLLAPIGHPLLAALIVVVFASFILAQREELRDRLAALAGADHLRLTTKVFDEASRRISHYLVAQLAVNAAFGILVAVALMAIGVPNALLFGVLAVPLRFAPVIGSWIIALLPTLLAAVVFDGWTAPLLTFGIIVGLELAVAHIVEPMLFGVQTGLSAPAVLLALLFWTWLWGAAGLVLAIPLTVCVAVLGRHLPQLRWLSVALDGGPALSPAMRFYQRVLALDEDDALSVLREARAARGFVAAAEELVGPALRQLERDRHGHSISRELANPPLLAIRAIVEVVIEDEPTAVDLAAAPSHALATEPVDGETGPDAPAHSVVCVPASHEADEILAMLLAHAVRLRGMRATSLSSSLLASERAEAAHRERPAAICVCAVPPLAESRARHAIRRLRGAPAESTHPAQIVAALWSADPLDSALERLETAGAAGVASTLEHAVRQAVGFAHEGRAAHAAHAEPSEVPAPSPSPPTAR